MSTNPISFPDFTEAERRLVGQTLLERYGKTIPLQFADAELQLTPGSENLTTCPALYWEEEGTGFVIFKTGTSFRCQFFYSETQQYGTGRDSYDNLGDCVITLLQVQADHERQLSNISKGTTAAMHLDDDDYHGPLVV